MAKKRMKNVGSDPQFATTAGKGIEFIVDIVNNNYCHISTR